MTKDADEVALANSGARAAIRRASLPIFGGESEDLLRVVYDN